jgi:hypothetical protein
MPTIHQVDKSIRYHVFLQNNATITDSVMLLWPCLPLLTPAACRLLRAQGILLLLSAVATLQPTASADPEPAKIPAT